MDHLGHPVGHRGSAGRLRRTRALSPDARYLIFASKATNATAGTNTFGKENLYRRDLQTGTTARITFTTTGGDPNEGSTFSSMTADGRYVSFFTGATNMDANHTGGALSTTWTHNR